MSLARTVITLMDRPGGRALLAKIAERRTGIHVEYEDRWFRVLPDGLVLADQQKFPYYLDTLANSPIEIAAVEAAARDSWFFDYSPMPTDVVVDVGAGAGIETRVFANAVARVYAIEAHPETFARLEATVRLNGWRNVMPIYLAVTDKLGPVGIENDSKDLRNAITDSGEIQVPGNTLDAICHGYEIKHIDFLKMNIEGAERLAIQGMSKTIEITERLCIACHDFRVAKTGKEFFRTKALVTDFLRQHGFMTVTRDDHPKNYARDHVYAHR